MLRLSPSHLTPAPSTSGLPSPLTLTPDTTTQSTLPSYLGFYPSYLSHTCLFCCYLSSPCWGPRHPCCASVVGCLASALVTTPWSCCWPCWRQPHYCSYLYLIPSWHLILFQWMRKNKGKIKRLCSLPWKCLFYHLLYTSGQSIQFNEASTHLHLTLFIHPSVLWIVPTHLICGFWAELLSAMVHQL